MPALKQTAAMRAVAATGSIGRRRERAAHGNWQDMPYRASLTGPEKRQPAGSSCYAALLPHFESVAMLLPTIQPARLARRLTLALAMLLPGVALAEPAMVYLVRHGEKASAGKDPELTPQGRERARNIAALLHRTGIQAIFSTPTARTLQTAQPLAERLGVKVEAYAPDAPQALVEQVRKRRGAVLVVGHSNTLPELVRLFGGAPGPDIGDDEYDRLYQLVTAADGKVTTVLWTSLPAGGESKGADRTAVATPVAGRPALP